MRMHRVKYLIGGILLAFSMHTSAYAQESEDEEPPVKTIIDENGVNVMFGMWLNDADLGLSSNIDPDLKINQFWIGRQAGLWSNSWDIKVITSNGRFVVTFGNRSCRFTIPQSYSGEDLWDFDGGGNRLRFDTVQMKYIFVAKDGTTATLDPIGLTYNGTDLPSHAYATLVVFPNGKTWSISYDMALAPGFVIPDVRMRAITSSLGVGSRIAYATDDLSDTNNIGLWHTVTSMSLFNSALEYCPVSALTCTFANNWPSISVVHSGSIAPFTDTFTDPLGNVWSYSADRFRMASLRFPADQTDTETLTWGDVVNTAKGWGVTSITIRGVRKSYAYSDVEVGGYIQSRTTVVTDPYGKTKTYTGHPISIVADEFLLDSYTDELSRTFSYEYDGYRRPTTIHYPEGDVSKYTYDSRGNITERRRISKTPGSPADTVVTSVFPTTCTTAVTCNKPTAKIDARGYQTDFTYDPIHGGMFTETAPAVNGIRPQKRYTYAQRYAWLKNSSGGYSPSDPSWVLASESHCQTSAANGSGCSLAGDEVVTTYDYGPDSGPNNLLLRGIVVTAGGQSRRTCYGYDTVGRKISETSPNANLTSCP